MTASTNTACNPNPKIEEITLAQKKLKLHTGQLTSLENKLQESQQVVIQKQQQEAFHNFINTQPGKIKQLEKDILQSLTEKAQQHSATTDTLENLQAQYDNDASVFHQWMPSGIIPLTGASSLIGYIWGMKIGLTSKSTLLLLTAPIAYNALPASIPAGLGAATISIAGYFNLFGMGFIVNSFSLAFGAKQYWNYGVKFLAGTEVDFSPIMKMKFGGGVKMDEKWLKEIALYNKALIPLAKTENGREISTKWLMELKQHLELAGKLENEQAQLEGVLQTGNQNHELHAKKLAYDLKNLKQKYTDELAEHAKLINRYHQDKEIAQHNKLISDLSEQIAKIQAELNAQNNRPQDVVAKQQEELKAMKERLAEESSRHQKTIDEFMASGGINVSSKESGVTLDQEIVSSKFILDKLTVEAESVRGAALELENKVTALKATIQEEMQQDNCLKQNYELNHAHEEL